MKRRYEELLKSHFADDGQMAFLAGPRQVGKTTSCMAFSREGNYFNWDNEDDRQLIAAGPAAVAERIGLSASPSVIFDGLHKYADWKGFLKGFFDTYGSNRLRIVVSGSARMDVYRKGADSLMGRYFMYRMHPLSVAEVLHTRIPDAEVTEPQKLADEDFTSLIRYGGFPEPYLKRNVRFYNRWKRTRLHLLFREEIRDTTRVYEIGQVEVLAESIRRNSGRLANYASLASRIGASQDSVKRWVSVLESLYYCFSVRPWTRNVSRSLLKAPKLFLWDWSAVDDPGLRSENSVAAHLLKAVHWWTDTGLGDYGLYFVRTKDKREIDFLVTRNDDPWFLVEAKTSASRSLSRDLEYFQDRIGARHAFQVAMEAPYVEADCFQVTHPVQVPARTFLSQLV